VKLILSFLTLLIPLLLQTTTANAAKLDNLTFGGQIRMRGESRNPKADYAKSGGVDTQMIRTRLNVGAEAAEGVKGFLQIQDSRSNGSSAPGARTQSIDLHQGYLDVEKLWELPLSLRAGRFSMDYGSRRLISSLDWSNIGRAWDGIRLQNHQGDFDTDLFVTNVTESGKKLQDDQMFSGLWNTYKGISNHVVDSYLLVRTADADTGGSESRHTLGFRFARVKGNLKYGAEGAGQWGFVADKRVSAWAGTLDGSYTFDGDYKPQVSAEYAYASGDKNPTDGMNQRFVPLYPFGHFYHGFADLQLWSNTHALKLAFAAKPCKNTWGQLAVHHFRLAQGADSWLGGTGTVIATDATATSGRNVGTEIDIHFKTTVRGALKLWYGYSHFIKGQYASRNITGSSNMDWAFLQGVINF